MAKRKDKQWSTQYYIEHERLNNPNLQKKQNLKWINTAAHEG
jgi:hypothetical protein